MAFATLFRFVMFFVVEGLHLLLANKLGPIARLYTTIQSLRHTMRNAFTVFDDLCLQDDDSSFSSSSLGVPYKMFALDLIGNALTEIHELRRKVCLSLNHPNHRPRT
jgi:hypothetical protein